MNDIVDLNKWKATKEAEEDDNIVFLICPHCDQHEFCPVVYKHPNGRWEVTHLVCVSEECNGESFVRVDNGDLEHNFMVFEDVPEE